MKKLSEFRETMERAKRMAEVSGLARGKAVQGMRAWIIARLKECAAIAESGRHHWTQALHLLAEVEKTRARLGLSEMAAARIPSREECATAYQIGRSAFDGIAGRLNDSMFGTKSAPTFPRCPYSVPLKVLAWHDGFDTNHDQFLREWDRDMAA